MKNTEIAKTKNAELTRPAPSAMMVPDVEGLEMSELTQYLPYLVLIQGSSNPLKDEFPDVKDGDIISNDGTPLDQPLEIQLLKGKIVYIEREVKLDKDGKLDNMSAGKIGNKDNKEFLDFQSDWVSQGHSCTSEGNLIYCTTADGELKRIFESSLIMLVLVGKLPYQISFKSVSKQVAAKKMLASLYRQMDRLGKTNLFELVVRLKSRKQKNQAGISYFSFDSQFSREATPEEVAAGRKFIGVDVDLDNVHE